MQLEEWRNYLHQNNQDTGTGSIFLYSKQCFNKKYLIKVNIIYIYISHTYTTLKRVVTDEDRLYF